MQIIVLFLIRKVVYLIYNNCDIKLNFIIITVTNNLKLAYYHHMKTIYICVINSWIAVCLQ